MANSHELSLIVGRARNRDIDALEILVDRYSARLYGFLFRMTGHPEDAEDMVQEVFVRMVKSIARYEEDGRFEAWLFRIAANLARDRGRRQKRNPVVGSIDEDSSETAGDRFEHRIGLAPSHQDPEQRMTLTEDIVRLQTALNRLPTEEREVVMLRHYTDMSFAEIADLMASPLGTALARAHRGLAKLRKWMESSA
ncbi:MAG: sigma-70 family RNA polymerase sigma factor [Planctomycetes bacterium]|nr:sigma-70 family RNA polymerase sigma factor [Planctomycetota bacterium]